MLAAPLLVVGEDSISAGEFRYAYRKNGALGKSDSVQPTLDSFLESYIGFRLKVCQAKALRLDTVAKFQQEYREYWEYQFAPLLLDTAERERRCREAYGRMLEEVDASHILISTEGGEAKAYEKALALRLRARSDAEFARLAREHSADPSAGTNGGHLGYFGAFRMVYPFEQAAFATKVGQVSKPVKTKFGYHLIRVHKRRKARGRMLVSHIMMLAPEGMDPKQREGLRKRLEGVRKELDEGANFEELVEKYSQDPTSKKKQGELPWVVTGRYPREFEDACFRLKKDGDYSGVVTSHFGFHIIKRLKLEEVPSYAESRGDILSQLQQNGVILEGSGNYRELARRRLGCRLQHDNLLAFSLKFGPARKGQKVEEKMVSWLRRQMTFARVDGRRLRLKELVRRMAAENADAGEWSFEAIKKLAWRMVDERADALLMERMLRQEPNLPYLLREFYNGLLFFSVSERELWNAESDNDEVLQKLYDSRPREKDFEAMRSELRMEYEQEKEKEWLQELRDKFRVTVYERELEALRQELEEGDEQ
ncbi:MAG: hypothetical protein CSA07_01825 [Bacteroidia bacterium]|nr:MAG: hypothetical protein CSA07_01825 [Bacteroidia bacterium]